MAPSNSTPESLLAVDIGSAHTRAMLFDIAADRYMFVAQGRSPSTAAAPFRDISEGLRLAIEELQKITGRVLIGKDERLILPSQPDGSGVDALVSTISAGPAVSIVAAGLLDDLSLESARRLAGTTYARIAESIGINDRRKTEVQIDAIIQAKPDVVIVAGGIESGATRSIGRILEVIGLASYLIPAARRPVLLYAGNQQMAQKVKSQFGQMQTVRIAPNLRPDFDHEDLGPAHASLSEIVQKVRAGQMGGAADLISLSNGHSYPTATAFGRMIRFLSKVYDSNKGVLGVDLGATSTVIAAANDGRLSVSVQTPLGIGEGLAGITGKVDPLEILQWMAAPASPDDILDYLHQKITCPGSLPTSPEEQGIEQAVVRAVLRQALKNLPASTAGLPIAHGDRLATPFEPIIAAGAALAGAPTPSQCALMILDGLQPIGVTTLVADPNSLAAALGAAARLNPVLPVQVLESGAFQNLGTVISPVSGAPTGAPILHARLVYADETETQLDITQGSLNALPLERGKTARLFLEPIGRTDPGIGRSSRGVKITGGVLGVIIDGRGRPIRLPADHSQRQETLQKWLWAISS